MQQSVFLSQAHSILLEANTGNHSVGIVSDKSFRQGRVFLHAFNLTAESNTIYIVLPLVFSFNGPWRLFHLSTFTSSSTWFS